MTSRSSLASDFVQKGYLEPFFSATPGSVTAGPVSLSFHVAPSNIGSSLPATIVGLPEPAVTTSKLIDVTAGATGVGPGWLARFYKVGTLDLTATGDKFTHDSATFPLLRTIYGQASQPLPLIPMLYMTTACTTTAPVIRLRTVAGVAGYVSQDGTSVVGTRTLTFTSASTAVGSTWPLTLEVGDVGVRNISAIEVTTASSTGAATIYLVELLSALGVPHAGVATRADLVAAAGPLVPEYQVAAATSGSLTTFVAALNIGASGRGASGFLGGVPSA